MRASNGVASCDDADNIVRSSSDWRGCLLITAEGIEKTRETKERAEASLSVDEGVEDPPRMGPGPSIRSSSSLTGRCLVHSTSYAATSCFPC